MDDKIVQKEIRSQVAVFQDSFDKKFSDERIVKEYFKPELIKPAHGLILRHVLEHVPNPVEFLFELKRANNNGRIYIEVPCFDWICKKHAWFDIFYEHVNYFRLNDFKRMFSTVVDSGHLFGGQYIYIVAELQSLQMPVIDHKKQVVFPIDFDKKITSRRIKQQCVIWGASSKGVIYSLLKARNYQKIDFAIDINPKKQGKYNRSASIFSRASYAKT